jgi:hypothetical protein
VASPLTAVLIATALSAGTSEANPPLVHSPGVTWGFEASGGWSTYRLGAFNDSLRSLNGDLGTTFKTVDGGPEFGVAVRSWANPRLLLRLYLEKLTAVAKSADIRYDIGPWSLAAGATHFFPSEGRLRLGAGIAAGVIGIRGEFKGRQFQFDARGSGPDLRAMGEAMWPLGRGWFVSGSAGLRYARVPEIRLGGSGTSTTADFSGLFLRLAIGCDGPPAKPPN